MSLTSVHQAEQIFFHETPSVAKGELASRSRCWQEPGFYTNSCWTRRGLLLTRRSSGRNGSGAPEPLLHLVVLDQTGLLHDHAASGEDEEVGYATNLETSGKLRVLFGIDF